MRLLRPVQDLPAGTVGRVSGFYTGERWRCLVSAGGTTVVVGAESIEAVPPEALPTRQPAELRTAV